ncbi:OLC1v1033501C1 [Oldenlandia corymbosa var. corymbosa]|uniref:OLC1v1033501C1 n=1 Tax=Oldenlandia corymbosa var. corymbosa TaxID=529605 RepID=A0AAV1CPV1_OLDCO|nr:OLC1v1033501C1 [Oldenlandia corymbosa var. corymbosa]
MRMEAASGGDDNSDAAYRSSGAPAPPLNVFNHAAGTTTSASANSSRGYSSHSRRLSASSILRSPLSAILEYSGIIRNRPSSHLSDSSTMTSGAGLSRAHRDRLRDSSGAAPSLLPSQIPSSATGNGSGAGEVSIRIIGAGEQDILDRVSSSPLLAAANSPTQIENFPRTGSAVSLEGLNDRGGGVLLDGLMPSTGVGADTETGGDGDGVGGPTSNINRDSTPYQRYDIQQAARWIEQVLPFSLLLLVVFIRQHLQGFFVTIWIAAVMFKSNDILRKQTTLKGERKISVLAGISIVFMLHVTVVYWWFWGEDLIYPFAMLPPKSIPPFWHAIFIIMVNDTLVRQVAMVVKCLILMYYKNSRGRSYRRQGQMLTLVEYLLLLYRALLPAPVWYRFFLNKEYGSLFSSLMTGLYLTFKLTSVVEKVQCFVTALKALSRKEFHYGAYATSEQVNAVGDLCAICQEKMHVPILLRCKHIFCEDCVSEWYSFVTSNKILIILLFSCHCSKPLIDTQFVSDPIFALATTYFLFHFLLPFLLRLIRDSCDTFVDHISIFLLSFLLMTITSYSKCLFPLRIILNQAAFKNVKKM